MPFKKGNPKPKNSGRKKGTPNKLTSDIKDMVFNALNDQRVGGEEEFIRWIIKSNRNREIFYSWLMRMLPSNVSMEHSGSIKTELSMMDLKESIKDYDEN